IAIVKNGDKIEIDIENRQINLLIDEKEMEKRLSELENYVPKIKEDVLKRYSYFVQSASKGATFRKISY
ncbi:MAG: dihydroxy-acid dehydratase, partial [Thermotogae bacterium]|nr:dihydroxy-acid dehydratase [Thermotogota bacterium]